MRQALEMTRNPAAMRELMRSQDRQLSNIEVSNYITVASVSLASQGNDAVCVLMALLGCMIITHYNLTQRVFPLLLSAVMNHSRSIAT